MHNQAPKRLAHLILPKSLWAQAHVFFMEIIQAYVRVRRTLM